MARRRVPEGAWTSCALTRTWLPLLSSVPTRTTSTSSAVANADMSAVSPAKRDAAAVERTTSDGSPESAELIASGRLNARNSMAGSGRKRRNGSTTRRDIGRTRVTAPLSMASAFRSSAKMSAV